MSCWDAIEGKRLCRVRMVHDRQQIDGTIRLTLPRHEGAFAHDTSLFEVHDEREGAVYLAQALSCWQEHDALVLTCTPLGLRIDNASGRPGDNYLIVPGHEPLPILGLCEAESECPKGDHLRFEIQSADWDRLGLRAASHQPCYCATCGREQGLPDQVWDFRMIYADAHKVDHPEAEIVMLDRLQRVAITIDLARRVEKVTTIISHAISRAGFSTTKATNTECYASSKTSSPPW